MPLGITLAAKAPNPETLDAAEAQAIDALTLSNVFRAVEPTPHRRPAGARSPTA